MFFDHACGKVIFPTEVAKVKLRFPSAIAPSGPAFFFKCFSSTMETAIDSQSHKNQCRRCLMAQVDRLQAVLEETLARCRASLPKGNPHDAC
jgi:hypothetical protein